MATITKTSMQGYGVRNVAVTTLDGVSDTFEFNESRNQILVLSNPTASAITPVITGADASTITVPGAGSFDVSGGYDVGSIAADGYVAIPLNSIREYLAGEISISSGTGLDAQLLEF